MNGGYLTYQNSDVVITMIGIAALGLYLLFTWLAPWSRRGRRSR